MSPEDRDVVNDTVRKHCEIRGWALHKVNARSNHVHVVVTTGGRSPETVRDQLKAWCSRMLRAHYPDRSRFWTEGASCRWINQEDDLIAAVEYAGDGQDRKWAD